MNGKIKGSGWLEVNKYRKQRLKELTISHPRVFFKIPGWLQTPNKNRQAESRQQRWLYVPDRRERTGRKQPPLSWPCAGCRTFLILKQPWDTDAVILFPVHGK